MRRLIQKSVPKGDVITTSQIAGVMAAKNTPMILPLCHPLLLSNVRVELELVGGEEFETPPILDHFFHSNGNLNQSSSDQSSNTNRTADSNSADNSTNSSADSSTDNSTDNRLSTDNDSSDTNRYRVHITSSVTCNGQTGVEMEALTACSAAALNVYDMCKPISKGLRIERLRLLSKSGGKSGDYVRTE
jgi:GTP 3',8-cyclase